MKLCNRVLLIGCCVYCFLSYSNLNADDLSASTVASGNQVKTFTGTDNVTLVFQNNGFLYLVDFTGSGDQKPLIKKMPQTEGAVVPNISPDGKWLVYGVEFSRNSYPIFIAFALPIHDKSAAAQINEWDEKPMAKWNAPDWDDFFAAADNCLWI